MNAMKKNLKLIKNNKTKCPTCGSSSVKSSYPFCSQRCSSIDLGKWFDAQPEGKVEMAVSRLKEDTLSTRKLFESYDFILSPVTQTVAPKIGSMAPDINFDALLERSLNFITFTPLANVTGVPAISLPMLWSSTGLPIGTHLHANYGNCLLYTSPSPRD